MLPVEMIPTPALLVLNGSASSRRVTVPPSPSSPSPAPDKAPTPGQVTIGPCPPRLCSLIPPSNYGTVDVRAIFRSAFPQDENVEFMSALKIRSVLSLVDGSASPGVQRWLKERNIAQFKVELGKNKPGKSGTSVSSMCEALLLILNSNNWPLHIHCNQGKHRTGCVVACLRKVQGVDMDDIIAEYRAYAGQKARDGDIEFVRSFDPAAIFDYAKRCGYFPDLLQGLKFFGEVVDPVAKNVEELVLVLSTPSRAYDLAKEMPTAADEDAVLAVKCPAAKAVCVA